MLTAEKWELAIGQQFDQNPCGVWVHGPRHFAVGHVVSRKGKYVFSYTPENVYYTFASMQNAYEAQCVDYSNYFNSFGTENE